MPALRHLVAVLLLILWLPATLHCALEAADIHLPVVCHEHETPEAAESHCADDGCHAIERENYTAGALAKLVGNVAFFVITLLPGPLELHSARISPDLTGVPRELRSRWQFSRRAARPARAPSARA